MRVSFLLEFRSNMAHPRENASHRHVSHGTHGAHSGRGSHAAHHAHGADDRHPGHGRPAAPARGLGIACLVVFSYSLVEIVVGLASGSLALASDGLHMLTDALALALAWGAQWIARRPPDAQLTFGYERAESLAAFVNALAYLVLLGWIVFEAIDRFSVPHALNAGLALPVAVAGLVVNAAVWWVLHRDSEDLNVRGALIHVMGDFAGSAIAIVAIVVGSSTGWTWIDPSLTLVISLLLLGSTVRLLRDSARVLMNATPQGMDLPAVSAALAGIDGVAGVHDLHVWSMSSGQAALAAHLKLAPGADWLGVLETARVLLSENFGVDHVTLQPEFVDPI
jgi:cobalt-zinc-cadmium efflux system protein